MDNAPTIGREDLFRKKSVKILRKNRQLTKEFEKEWINRTLKWRIYQVTYMVCIPSSFVRGFIPEAKYVKMLPLSFKKIEVTFYNEDPRGVPRHDMEDWDAASRVVALHNPGGRVRGCQPRLFSLRGVLKSMMIHKNIEHVIWVDPTGMESSYILNFRFK